jgi:2-oxoglutarate dehydrogenase E1 component
MIRPVRKPLIVLTPKSLLRNPASTSAIAELSHGRFQPLVLDQAQLAAENVKRIVFCSGKVYYDLAEARSAQELGSVAVIRIEELYPFPIDEYAAAIAHYPNAIEIVWCQEEPQNQGAWYQIRHRLQEPLSPQHELYYAGRPGAAAPASGILSLHIRQQKAFVSSALAAYGHERDNLSSVVSHAAHEG